MKHVIYNNIIPFKGFKAIALWPFVFVRNSARERFTQFDENHERIHLKQQVEMLLVFFYLWYGIEWLVRLVAYRHAREAYRNISFEQEAYIYQGKENYLAKRRWYAWTKFLNKKSFVYKD